MSTITLTNTFVDATTIEAADFNDNFDDIVNECNGSLDGDNISSSAALSVATLTTSGNGTIGGVGAITGNATVGGTLAVTGTSTLTGNTTVTGTLTQTGAATLASTLAVTGKSTFAATVQTVTTATDGATVTFDVTKGNIHAVTLGGNRTLAISGETTGQCFIIELTQDATGSRTVTWFSTIKWAGGSAPTLTTTATKRDTFGFRVTGTDTYDAFLIGQNI